MDYEKLSVSELKELAKEKGVKGITALKKADLITAIKAHEESNKPKAVEGEKEAKQEKKLHKKSVKAEAGPKPETKPEPDAEKPKTEPSSVADNTTASVKKEVIAAEKHFEKRQDRQQDIKPEKQPERISDNNNNSANRQKEIRDKVERYSTLQNQPGNRPNQGGYQNGYGNRPNNNQNNQRQPQFRQGQQNRGTQYQQPQRQMRTPGDNSQPAQNSPAVNNPVPAPAPQAEQHQQAQNTPNVQNHSTQPNNVPVQQAPQENNELDSGIEKKGILEIMPEGYGFIRCDNFLPGPDDVYVSPMQIKRYGLRSGDIICGNTKIQMATEKFSALLYIKDINGYTIEETVRRKKFETLTPIFPKERLHMETPASSVAMRMVDLIAPIGKGQRGMIVSQPKSGKTTLLKEIANSITRNHPDIHLIILLIDERPEEVTDMKESIHGEHVEVIYSTFDELPDKHKRVSEMVIERAKRLVEYGNDVVILLDSITRLARAYNLTVNSSGKTLSGGLDPAALHMPKKFFGAARTMREGGSLTILATALVDTGSRMDDVVFEEFKGTGNMELVLDRNLSERRIFPAIDLAKSGTRRDDLLLNHEECEAMAKVRRALNGAHAEDTTEKLINMCAHTRNNREFVNTILKSLNV